MPLWLQNNIKTWTNFIVSLQFLPNSHDMLRLRVNQMYKCRLQLREPGAAAGSRGEQEIWSRAPLFYPLYPDQVSRYVTSHQSRWRPVFVYPLITRSHPPRNYCMNQMVPELTKNNHVGHACSLLLLQHPAFRHQKTDESRCQNCLSETSSKFKAPKNPLCGKLMNLGLHWGWW